MDTPLDSFWSRGIALARAAQLLTAGEGALVEVQRFGDAAGAAGDAGEGSSAR